MITSQGNVLHPENREEAWNLEEQVVPSNSGSLDGSGPQGVASNSLDSTSPRSTSMFNGTTLAICTILLIVPILGFAGWRIRAWRRHQIAGAGATLDNATWPVKLSAALPRERSLEEIKSNLLYEPRIVALAPSMGNYPLPFFPVQDSLTPSSLHGYSLSTHANVPPPALSSSNTNTMPNTPAPTLQISPPPAYTDTHVSRTVSIPPFAIPASPSMKLPRLVVVVATFDAMLPDELEIREGDTLRLLAEYEDEWCLVQPIDRTGAEKGVVPRLCLADKPPGAGSSRKSKHFPRLRVSIGIKR